MNSTGKIPPQAIDAEKAIIGAILTDTEAIYTATAELDEDAFYLPIHAMIYKACVHLHNSSQPTDIMTVGNELNKRGQFEQIGGNYALVEFSMGVSSTVYLENHCRIVQEKFVLRSALTVFNAITQKGYDKAAEASEILTDASAMLNKLTESLHRRKETSFAQIVDAVVEKAEAVGRGEVEDYIPTPIKALTKSIAGFRGGKVYILAARPGMGKTSFAGQCLYEASKHGAALFVSLEMTETDIARRLFTVVSESLTADVLFSNGIRTHRERNDVNEAARELKKMNIHIQSEFSTLSSLKSLVKIKARAQAVKFVVVDYLQLVSPDKSLGNREQEISTISRELKKLALELDVPILLLSQLSRKCEERGNKRPLPSDLRDSGAIEQDADAIMFLYRESVYSGDVDDDTAEIIVAKNRNGGLGVVNCRFIGERMVYKADELPSVEGQYQQPTLRPELPYNDNPF